MGANSQFHKVIGVVEIVVGVVLDYFGFTWIGTPLILTGLQSFEGVPGMPRPVASALRINPNSAITPMSLLYGETKIGGPLLVGASGDGSGDTDGDYKYIAVAHTLSMKTGAGTALPVYGVQTHDSGDALNPKNFLTGYWFDTVNLPMVGFDGSGNFGGMSTHTLVDNYNGLVQIVTHLGNQTVVDPLLAAGLSYWTTNFIGHGLCYSVVKIHADPTNDQVAAAFPNGLPQAICALLSGQLLYDPRLDSTAGGSGSHRKADPSTWQYYHSLGGSPVAFKNIGCNPALQVRDYLTRATTEGGVGIDPARVPDDYLAAAASICEETLTVPSGSGGTVSIQKYVGAIGLNTGDDCQTNLQKLLDAMCGWAIQTAGEIRIFAGKYVAPTTTITDSWLAGPITFLTTGELDTRWNTVDATYTDGPSGYIEIQTPPFSVTGAVAADGGIIRPKKLSTPAIDNQYRAQYATHISANQSRNMRLLTLPLNVTGVDVDEGEVVTLQITEYALNSNFMVLNWKRQSDSSVIATVIEQPSTTFNAHTFNEQPAQGANFTDTKVPKVVGLAAADAAPGIRLNWTAFSKFAVTSYEVWRSTSSGGVYARVAKGVTSAQWTDPLTVTGTYYYKVKAVNYRGVTGAFSDVASATSHAVADLIGGTGPNLEPSRYAIVTAKTPTYAVHTSLTVGRAASTKKYGYLALQVTSTSGAVAPKLALSSGITVPNMTLKNRLYGLQVWGLDVDADANAFNFNFCLKNTGGTDACTPVLAVALGGGVYGAVLDMSAAADLDVYLQMEWNGVVANTKRIDFQGWGVYRMPAATAPHPELAAGAAASQDDLGDGNTLGAVLQTGLASNAVDLSTAATDGGTGVEGIIHADTVNLADGAGLGQTADATLTTNLPATLDAATALGMITDAQKTFGVASAVRQALFSDGGAAYFDDPFGGAADGGVVGATNFLAADATLTGSMVTYGNKWVIPNVFSSRSITVMAWLNANFFVSGGTGDAGDAQIQISLDGGSTWTTSAQTCGTRCDTTNHTTAGGVCQHSVTGVPTGSVQIRAQAQHSAGANTMTLQAARSSLSYVILNSNNGIVAGTSNLAASLPGTASMSCGSTYPTTTCAAVKNLTVSASGGLPPYTFSNAKTAGSGTITSGSSAQTFTVSDTETTTTGGATHTTTVQSTVTDSQTYTMSTGATESGSTVTGTLTASALMAVGTLFDMASVVPSGYNGTGLAAASGTTGTTLKYLAGSSGLGATTHTGTVSNVRIVTSTCVVTGTYTLSYPAVSVSLASTGGGCKALLPPDGAGTCTGTVSFTTNATGGDGSFTYANSKTSGGGTVTSGSTSKNWTAQESGSVPWSDTGTYKSIVTDGHSNTGNKSKTVTFSGSVL